ERYYPSLNFIYFPLLSSFSKRYIFSVKHLIIKNHIPAVISIITAEAIISSCTVHLTSKLSQLLTTNTVIVANRGVMYTVFSNAFSQPFNLPISL
ncbi:hypothetical protein, partial [Anaerosphaera multitolerans]|uniref:hypothetical protein n=1 Tax=Anaerosphaera multitolerans TaxID=2487351 RepID=UPI00196B3D04